MIFLNFIQNESSSVELVGEGTRGGKVVRLFHGKRPGARKRIVHKSTERSFMAYAACRAVAARPSK